MSEEIKDIIKHASVIAVVGLSDNPSRPSYGVAEYLQSQGFRIIPINPAISSVLGETSYPNLKAVPEKIDIVDIFRKPEAVPEIVDEAIAVKAKTIWMQEGIEHPQAAEKAKQAGLNVVMNKCLKKETMKWGNR